jgi:hypothetical protein
MKKNMDYMRHEKALRETILAMRGYAGWIGQTPSERELINAIRMDVKRARRALGLDDEGEPSSTTLVPIERHGKLVVFETRPWPQKGHKRWSVGSVDGLGILEEGMVIKRPGNETLSQDKK